MTAGEHQLHLAAGGPRPPVQAVDALIARVQDLVDTRTTAGDRLAWSVEASFLGDATALAMLAALAAGAA